MSKKKNNDYKKGLMKRSEEAKTVRKIVMIIILSLILIIIIGGTSGFVYIKSALGPVDADNDEEITIEIPLGSSTSDIATLLESENVIKDARVFRFYTKFKNTGDFQAGEYSFKQSLGLDEIIELLQEGKLMSEPSYTVTIPEGKSIDEIAEIYSKKLPIDKKEFLKKVNDPDFIKELMEQYPTILTDEILNEEIRTPLEGYLFASTYSFYEEDPTPEDVVHEMLHKTEEVIEPYQEQIKEKEFTVHEAITFASVIENEARTEEQRKEIAGVLYNRLEEGMKLQTDPTVLYAKGEHQKKVSYEDLEIESPYNTYYVDSLPIGPISNFAEISFEAVVEPEDNDNLYYLHDNKGNIYYSETNEEHNKLKEKYIE